MKQRGEKITMITSYDYPTSLLVDRAGIDVILVGDSVGMVVLGYRNPIPVTIEDILHDTKLSGIASLISEPETTTISLKTAGGVEKQVYRIWQALKILNKK